MQNKTRGIDMSLLGWIYTTIGRPDIPYDLKKIKRLENKKSNWPFDPDMKNIPSWLEPKEGDYSLIGEMTNLQTLSFHEVEVADFSFLTQCKKLRKLDLKKTNFTDCTLLTQLPELSMVFLPPRKKLIHPEVLDDLSAQVKIEEPFYHDEDFSPFVAVSQKELASDGPSFSTQYIEVHYRGRLAVPPPLWPSVETKYRTEIVEGEEITPAAVSLLIQEIRIGNVSSLCLSPDADCETLLLTADMEQGWAAIVYADLEQDVYYHSYNPKYTSVEELAPPQVGGQSPVPKPFAFDDLNLAAECIAYFIQHGRLSPDAEWAQELFS